jgi:acetyl esterase/lipase
VKNIFALALAFVLIGPSAYGQQPGAIFRWTVKTSSYSFRHGITYLKASGQDIKLDVISIRPKERPRPTVLYIHGGGWTAGSKDGVTLGTLPFLAEGMDIVNINYRLAGTALAPAAVEDCRCALRWVYTNAGKYGFDTNRILLVGESAGGHLALTTGILPPNSEFDNQCAPRPGKPPLKVAGIVSYSGPTDVADLLQGPHQKQFALRWLGSLPDRMELARRVSPLTYVRPGLPPIIIVQSKDDIHVPYDQALRLHKALDEAGDPNQLLAFPGTVHGWMLEQEINVQEQVFKSLEKFGLLPR